MTILNKDMNIKGGVVSLATHGEIKAMELVASWLCFKQHLSDSQFSLRCSLSVVMYAYLCCCAEGRRCPTCRNQIMPPEPLLHTNNNIPID